MLSAAIDLDELVMDLDVRGYGLIRAEPDQESMTAAAARFGAHVDVGWMGVRLLESPGSAAWLPRHTEQLDDPEPLRYFALGCLEASASGGATCLYDGRIAARALLESWPELAQVRITYTTEWRPTAATHPLVVHDPQHGAVLRFRSALATNAVHGPLPPSISEASMYAEVEAALSAAVAVVHRWRPGDLLVVDNRAMIHSREPFTGTRRMVRYRYDDPHFKTVIITR
ncbi:TauD/TfdA family dioxygenase [Glycomyces sp. A-F 0318]|uniref:TauD/TfdA family dioxygenase n=1 Tax=Glycomyces amatae TaxID=2881355 RepID=UPI001E60F58F|nr:TauD/TfdA family dioxygenase [Glycomyces amatae]